MYSDFFNITDGVLQGDILAPYLFIACYTCRNFGKELVILFHRTAAAPWGHVASIIKRSSTGDSLSFCSTPTTVSIRSIIAAFDGIRILVPSTTGIQERRTHVLSLKEQDTHS